MQESRKTNYNFFFIIYCAICFYYTLQISNDLFSNFELILCLVMFCSIPNNHTKKYILAKIAVKLFIIFVSQIDFSLISYLDISIMRSIISLQAKSINLSNMFYLMQYVLSWAIFLSYRTSSKVIIKQGQQQKFVQFISYCLSFLNPLMLYCLCYTKLTKSSLKQWIQTVQINKEIILSDFQIFQQSAWAILTALFLVITISHNNVRKMINLAIIILVVRDQIVVRNSIQATQMYSIQPKIIIAIKIFLFISFRVHNKVYECQQKTKKERGQLRQGQQDSSSSRKSAYIKFTQRRRLSIRSDFNEIRVIFRIILTILTMVLTNSLGNILVIFAVASNLPNYSQIRFRVLIALGITISLTLQPYQFIYFIYLYLVRRLYTGDHSFKLRSWWILIELGRMVILLNKISVLNFLIGLFKGDILVLFALIFRNICSYFRQIVVFMGTDDKYYYFVQDIIPSTITTDIVLWLYLILVKLYSPISTKKFEGTQITNIFAQYSILQKVEVCLKILKIFHWITYASISFVILSSQPSIFTMTRIVPLVIVFAVSLLSNQKSQWLYRLWTWNFYTSFSIAFVKYFYFLTKYDNLSPWLIALLQPLKDNWKIIGLTPPDNNSLVYTFGSDLFVIIVNAVVLYVIQVEISQTNYHQLRQRVYQEDHINQSLLQYEDKSNSKNIHYLYKNYIKPIQFKFKESSPMRPIMTDFILDVAFISFLAVYFILNFYIANIVYTFHFMPFLFGFIFQKTKTVQRPTFISLTIICSLDLIFLYLSFVYSVLLNRQTNYSLFQVLCKMLMLIISFLFYETNQALNKFYKENKKMKTQGYLILKWLSPIVPVEKIKKQIIVLYMHLFKCATIGLFLPTFLIRNYFIIIVHCIVIIFFFIIYIFSQSKRNLHKIYWIYMFYTMAIFDLWIGHLPSLLYLITSRFYFFLIKEFDILINAQKYGYSSNSLNEQAKINTERVEHRFIHEKKMEKLEVILEVRQNMQKSNMSNIEDGFIWKHKNVYITIVWLIPLFSILICQLGIIYFFFDVIGHILFIFSMSALIFTLFNLDKNSLPSNFVKVIIFSIFLITSLTFMFKCYKIHWQNIQQNIFSAKAGLFFIYFACLIFYQHYRYSNDIRVNNELQYSYFIDFTNALCNQAISYWLKKCELVSELGSQIHNQKKLLTLKKYFLNRENLCHKVQNLRNDFITKENDESPSKLNNIQHLENSKEDLQLFKKQQFQVYSNMLTFMSIDDLEFCYLDLNRYYNRTAGNDVDLAKQMRAVRKWVLQHYQSSITFTLAQYNYFKFSSQILSPISQSKMSSNQIEQNDVKVNIKKVLSQEQNGIDHNIQIHQTSQQTKKQGWGQRIDMRLNQISWFLRKIIQNIEIIGLFITAGWNFFGGVYTIPTNIAIFSWALVLETKTTVIFWLFLMVYSALVLACKLILSYLPSHFFINFLFYYHPNDYFYQYLIIFTCAIEIVFLRLGGTTSVAYSQRQNIFDAFFRNILNQSSANQIHPMESTFLEVYQRLTQTKHSFFYRVFSKGRLKPGKDLYPLLAILQLIILLYIFFFYDMMQFQSKNNRKSLGEILQVSQFSKKMIMALFFQVVIMIADRVIVSLNIIDPDNQALQNFFLNFAFKQQLKYFPPKNIQNLNKFDCLLILKYIFHTFLLICVNFFVYFYIPSGGFQKNLIPECQNAVCGKSYNYLSFFLLLYLIYFIISGLQIKHGFNRNKCRNTLMERYHWIDYYIYMFFTGIPFLWEFKKISDWTTTSTALPLFHWMKFQDINARLYQSKCEAQILKLKPKANQPWYKWIVGFPSSILILAIIFSPIVIYSSFNPFAIQDSIVGASLKLELVMDNKINYQFFRTSHTNFKLINQHQTIKFFDRSSLYQLSMSSFPDQDFMLSSPAVAQLAYKIKNSIEKHSSNFQMKMNIIVSEKQGGQTSIQWASKKLSDKQLTELYKLITSNEGRLQISSFYSPYPGNSLNQSILVTTPNQGQYFQLYTYKSNDDYNSSLEKETEISVFFKSSVKYNFSVGLVTFYLTYVVLINSLFRFYLTGGLDNIIFEGAQLEKVLVLCEAVRSARILQNFYQQQYLYFSLVDLMRHPRKIKEIGGNFSQLRQKVNF